MKKLKDNYLDLLKSIKNTKGDNYKPKNYSFNLDNFDDDGNKKIENKKSSISKK